VSAISAATSGARNGLSNEQIALNLGIGETTFYTFVHKHEELEEALISAREDAEIIVENALFKRAVGYRYKETTKERIRVLDEDGKWTGQYTMKTTKVVEKEVAPDVGAAQYWLEHRAPKRWERNPMPGLDIQTITEGLKSLAQLIQTPQPERAIGSEDELEDDDII
jgi:hypothetical protein